LTSEELLAHAELGERARVFLETDVGRYLVGMAENEVKAAAIEISKLNRESPDFPERFGAQQRRIQCADYFQAWIGELLVEGESAFQELELRRRDES
jgi:hypothetical protein